MLARPHFPRRDSDTDVGMVGLVVAVVLLSPNPPSSRCLRLGLWSAAVFPLCTLAAVLLLVVGAPIFLGVVLGRHAIDFKDGALPATQNQKMGRFSQ